MDRGGKSKPRPMIDRDRERIQGNVRTWISGSIALVLMLTSSVGWRPRVAFAGMNRLQHLAVVKFPAIHFSKCELSLLKNVSDGRPTFCGPTQTIQDPVPSDLAAEKTPYDVHADLISWLILDSTANTFIGSQGIFLASAHIMGPLNLSSSIVLFPLTIVNSAFDDDLNLDRAKLSDINLFGSKLDHFVGNNMAVQGEVILAQATIFGGASVVDAHIGGNLNCESAHVTTFTGDRLRAKGVDLVFLVSEYGVRMRDAILDGVLDIRGAHISPLVDPDGSIAIDATRLRATDVTLDRAQLAGTLVLNYAVLAGKLSLFNTDFRINSTQFPALSGHNLKATEIYLVDDRIPNSVVLSGANVQGPLAVSGVNKYFDLAFYFDHARVGEFDTDASIVGSSLTLDGFVYDTMFIPSIPASASIKPIVLLSLQPAYKPQPYEQLAKVLRDAGQDQDARAILIAKYDQASEQKDLPVAYKTMSWLLRSTVAYGYNPLLAIERICLVLVIGVFLCLIGRGVRAFIPTDAAAANQFRNENSLPWNYPRFSLLLFSIDAFVPLIDLRQKGLWMLDPTWGFNSRIQRLNVLGGMVFRGLFWVLVIVGYILLALFLTSLAPDGPTKLNSFWTG
jgi:hypothetical protein